MDFFEWLEIPMDESDPRYCQSFSVNEAESKAAQDFFEEFGFVIFRSVITEETCQETINDMWNLLEQTTPSINRNDTDTWNNKGWTPFGMPKNIQSNALFRPSLLRIRQNESVVRCFAGILENDNIFVNHDRWLMHRPTVSETGEYRSKWATKTNIHLDLNPAEFIDPRYHGEVEQRLGELQYSENQNRAFISETLDLHDGFGRVVQGILNLGDLPSSEDGGGTILVPGSHRWFNDWAKTLSRSVVGPSQHKFGQELNSLAQRATMRPGSLLIWDQRLMHGSTANLSTQCRYGIPIRFFHAQQLSKNRARDRAATLARFIKAEGFGPELTRVGKKVFFGTGS